MPFRFAYKCFWGSADSLDFLTDVDQIDDKPQVDHQDKGSIFYFEVEYFSNSCL